MSFPKVACFQSSAHSRCKGHANKVKLTMSNTYVDLCILRHVIRGLKLTHCTTVSFHIWWISVRYHGRAPEGFPCLRWPLLTTRQGLGLGCCDSTVWPSVSALAVTWSWLMLITLDLLCVYFMAQLAEWSSARLRELLLAALGRWTGGFGCCLPWYSAVTLAFLRTLRLNRGCVVMSDCKHFLLAENWLISPPRLSLLIRRDDLISHNSAHLLLSELIQLCIVRASTSQSAARLNW